MYYIHGGRATGKTTYLITQSAMSHVPIMVTTNIRKRHIQDQAKWLGVSIPEPIVWNPGAHNDGLRVRKVLVDDGEDFLRHVMFHTARAEAMAMAISEPVEELPVKHMTNADRIRAMSDEELAKFLSKPCECTVDPTTDGYRECGNNLCIRYLLEWLKQPAEADNGQA